MVTGLGCIAGGMKDQGTEANHVCITIVYVYTVLIHSFRPAFVEERILKLVLFASFRWFFNEFRSWVCIIADINGLKSCKISRDMYDWVSEAAKMDSEHLFLPSVRKHALKAPRASLYICNGLYQVD